MRVQNVSRVAASSNRRLYSLSTSSENVRRRARPVRSRVCRSTDAMDVTLNRCDASPATSCTITSAVSSRTVSTRPCHRPYRFSLAATNRATMPFLPSSAAPSRASTSRKLPAAAVMLCSTCRNAMESLNSARRRAASTSSAPSTSPNRVAGSTATLPEPPLLLPPPPPLPAEVAVATRCAPSSPPLLLPAGAALLTNPLPVPVPPSPPGPAAGGGTRDNTRARTGSGTRSRTAGCAALGAR